jgi:hypothetical protein
MKARPGPQVGIDDVGVHLAVGDQLGDVLDQRGLRRDRIHGDHVGTRQRDAQRGGFVAFDQHDLLLRRLGRDRCFKGGGSHAASGTGAKEKPTSGSSFRRKPESRGTRLDSGSSSE